MKKLLITMSSLSVWNTAAMNPEEMRLATISESDVAVTRLSANASIIRQDQPTVLAATEEAVDLSARVNFRQVRDPVRLGDSVRVSIRDFTDDGGQRIPAGDRYTRTYPLQKTFLRYHHDVSSGFSSPVQELFAMVTDIEHADRHGKMIVDQEYLDMETRIPHQIRETGNYQMDDDHLQGKPFTEIFITADGGSVIVDEAKIRDDTAFVAYTLIDRSEPTLIGVPEARADDAEFNYQRTETTERWRRPDTTIFAKRTEGVQKVAKPTPPPVVQAAPPVIVQQQPPRPRSPRTAGDVVRNVFTLGGGCTIQ